MTMQRRSFLVAGLAVPTLARARPLAWQTRSLVGFGTTLRLQAGAADADVLSQALDAAVQALRDVEASMSLFRSDSEVCRLNREGRLDRPSAHLHTVLHMAQQVSAASGGAFDVTVQPLWTLYDRARGEQRLPAADEIVAARCTVGWRGLSIDPAALTLARPGMAVTLNGIAQGYAADVARDTLRAHGVVHALVDAGEFAAVGHNAQGQPWTVGLEDPHHSDQLLAALPLQGRCVATSADNRSTFTPDRRHHHLFDPATGDSPAALSSVSVVADRAVLADALTKVMFVAGPARIPALARRWGVDVWWVDKAGHVNSTVVGAASGAMGSWGGGNRG